LVYYYMELGDNCYVYRTDSPVEAPCHVKGAQKFSVGLHGPFLRGDILYGLSGHITPIHQGWHTLYQIDSYAFDTLESLLWFEKNKYQKWMPSLPPHINENAVAEVRRMKAVFDTVAPLADAFKPQKEWGFFSETLLNTIRNRFVKERLKGSNIEADAFYQKACDRFRRGLKLAPWLKPLYEFGYCLKDNALFFALENRVVMQRMTDDSETVSTADVDGTTGSVREAMKHLLNVKYGWNLKGFYREHTDLLDRIKNKEPGIYGKLMVKVLFD
jgi:hypothetical protein